MRTLVLAGIIALTFSTANAACFGSSSFQNCSDSYGNNYTVQRYGNSTYMQGNNARTGSSWSQDSTNFGNSTFTNGVTNGRSWNMQQNSFGGVSTYSGQDSNGDFFGGTCVNGFCN